jgi:hypothetical protein
MEQKIKPEVLDQINKELPTIRKNQEDAQRRMGCFAVDSATGIKVRKNADSYSAFDPWVYKFALKDDLDSEDVKSGIVAAIKNKQQDRATFNVLLTIMDRYPSKVTNEAILEYYLDKLERKILDWWLAPDCSQEMSYCFYNDPALLKLLKFLIPQNIRRKLTIDRVRKTYMRLGLKKAERLLFNDVEFYGDKFKPLLMNTVKT